MKKFTALFLITIALCTIIVTSCTKPKDDTTQETTQETTTETVVTEPEYTLNVPKDKTYNGYKYNIYSYELKKFATEHLANEINGDLVNDAVFDRNRNTEELFDVKINSIINKWDNDDCRKLITASVMSGDNDYDLLTGNGYNFTYLSANGIFLNISKLPYIDVNNPWWNMPSYKELSVGKNAYLLMGDISKSNYGLLNCIMFNKNLLSDYSIENPYDCVYNDTWTLTKLISLTKDFYKDLNGNGVRDEDGDLYGFYSAVNSIYSIANDWIDITTKNSDNYPEVTFYNDRTATMYDTLKDWLMSSTGSYTTLGWTDYEIFTKKNISLFTCLPIGDTTNMRDVEFDYGFVPTPKYDENQLEYSSYGGGLFVAFPATAPDPDRSSMVAEALCYYGKELVYPAYVEYTLSQKGTRDKDAQAMLEIILNHVKYNFGVEFSGFKGFGYGLLEYMISDKGFSSFYESMSSSATAELKQYADNILALN